MWTWLARLALGFLWTFVSSFLRNYSSTYGSDQKPLAIVAKAVADAEAKFTKDQADEKYAYVYAQVVAVLKANALPVKDSLINALIEAAVQTLKESGVSGLLASAGL